MSDSPTSTPVDAVLDAGLRSSAGGEVTLRGLLAAGGLVVVFLRHFG